MKTTTITEVRDDAGMAAAFAIRRAVFCDEQGVAEEIEIDGLDPECRHYLAHLDGVAVGTARVRRLDDGAARVERVAVLSRHRKAGIGRALMERALVDIDAAGPARVVLNAQTWVAEFYARLGFVAEGEEFDEAGIPHVHMVRSNDR